MQLVIPLRRQVTYRQWVNEEILSINNLGGFLFQADLEKSNTVSESLSRNTVIPCVYHALFSPRKRSKKSPCV